MIAADLVLRPDIGPATGHGHVARCLSLAHAWRGDGRRLLAAEHLPEPWASEAVEAGVTVIHPREVPDAAVGATVVVDGYRIDPATIDDPSVLGVVNDFGIGPITAPVDIVVDPSIHGSSAVPSSYELAQRRLVGPRYAPIRPSLAAGPGQERGGALLLALGGDPTAAVRAWAEALPRGLPGERLLPLAGVDDVRAVLETCDLAVSAAGSTIWELCRFGIPIVAVAVADNQLGVLDTIERAGVGVALGRIDDLSAEAVASEVRRLRADRARFNAMADRARSLVDGRGAARIASALRGTGLTCRPAMTDDARLLFAWANDPATRSASFATEPIEWEDHVAWMQATLDDPDVIQTIVEERSSPVGTFRIDVAGAVGTVGVNLAPQHRSRGLAAAVIDAGSTLGFAAMPRLKRLEALIRDDNQRSTRAFVNADYDPAGSGVRNGVPWHSLVRSRPEEHLYR